MSFDRRAPGTATIRPTADGRWRIAFDGQAVIMVDTRAAALALVPRQWPFLIDPDPEPPER